MESGETSPDSKTLEPSRVTSRSSCTTRRRCCTTRAIFNLHEFEPISIAAKVCIASLGPGNNLAIARTIHERGTRFHDLRASVRKWVTDARQTDACAQAAAV